MRQSHSSASSRSSRSSEASERSSDESGKMRLYEKEARRNLAGGQDVFFGSQFSSDTNLAAYSEQMDERSERGLSTISEREQSTDTVGLLSQMNDSAGIRRRRYASADGYQNLQSAQMVAPPFEQQNENKGWFNWFGKDPLSLKHTDSDNEDKGRSQSTPAPKNKFMRQLIMERMEGVDDTPLSSKRSCSEFTRYDMPLDVRLDRTDTLQGLNVNVVADERPGGLFGLGLFSGKKAKKPPVTGTKSSLKDPSSNKASKSTLFDARLSDTQPRKVTFQETGEGEEEEEEELSFLVESLGGRSLSAGSAPSSSGSKEKERTRSTNLSVTGLVGADEIPESSSRSSGTPRGKKMGVWSSLKSTFSGSGGKKKRNSTGNMRVDPGAASNSIYASPVKSSLHINGLRETPSRNDGQQTTSSPPTHYMHISPPRSSLLLESEREAKNILGAIFGFGDGPNSRAERRSWASSEGGRRSSLTRHYDHHSHHQLHSIGNPEHAALHSAMRTSGVEVEPGAPWEGLDPDHMEIELKPLSKSSARGSYSSYSQVSSRERERASGSSGGGEGRTGGSRSPANMSTAHSSYDSLYNLLFHSAERNRMSRSGASSGSGSDRGSGYDWTGGIPHSTRSSFASHYTDGSDGWGLARSPRARTSSSVTSGSTWSDQGEPSGFMAVMDEGVRGAIEDLVEAGRARLMGPDDAAFAEFIRVQPFSTGGYMRGMLVTGMMSLFFHVFTLALWPRNELSEEELVTRCGSLGILLSATLKIEPKRYYATAEAALYGWFLLQVALNALQMPSRIMLHLWSWRCSRAVEAETSLQIAQGMIGSDIWVMNRMIGRIIDLCACISCVCCECYLWASGRDDPLRSLFVSLGATSLLAFIVRIGIAAGFTLSAHDPTVLAEARRRGLSKWDVNKLTSFVFTDFKEVNNKDCSICLGAFDLGEMVTMLPCDQKHSFHAPCIQEWLERQNSCPLCQKMV